MIKPVLLNIDTNTDTKWYLFIRLHSAKFVSLALDLILVSFLVIENWTTEEKVFQKGDHSLQTSEQ